MSQATIGALRVVLGLDAAALEDGLRRAQGQLQEAARRMQRIGASLENLGGRLTLAVTAPMLAAGAGATRVAADFESAMTRVRIATQATDAQMEQLAARAREIGAVTVYSATEAASAMDLLARNGMSTAAILEGGAEAVTTLAAATDSALEPAAAAVTDVMSQFELTAAELPGAINQITGAVNGSKFAFDDYSLGIAQSGAVAAGLGVEFEDFNTVLAATSAQFSSGSDAGTSFRTFLQRLSPQSREAAAAIEQMNLRFYEANGSLRPMAEIAEELRTKLSGLNDEAKSQVLTTIFGSDAIRTALGLMQQGAAGLEQVRQAIAGVDAEAQAAQRMSGLAGLWERMTGAAEELGIAVGASGLTGALMVLGEMVIDVMEFMSGLPAPVLATATAMGAFAAAVGPLTLALGALAASIGSVLNLSALMAPRLAGMAAGMRAAAAGTGVLAAAMRGLQATMAFLFGPWGLAIAAITVALWGATAAAEAAAEEAAAFREELTQLESRISQAEAAAAAASIQLDNLTDSQAAAEGGAQDLAAEVDRLAAAHLRAADAAKEQEVAVLRALMMESGAALVRARDAYAARQTRDLRRVAPVIGPDGRDSPERGAIDLARGVSASSEEAAALARAQAAHDRAQSLYQTYVERPASSYVRSESSGSAAPPVVDREGGQGGGTSATDRERDLAWRREQLELQGQLDAARLRGSIEEVRQLEDVIDRRERIRGYEDAGLDTAAAQIAAERDRALMASARAEAQRLALADQERELALEVARIDGNLVLVDQLERQADMRRLIAFYTEQGLDPIAASIEANEALLRIDEARVRARERLRREAEAEHALELARFSGDSREVRRLERDRDIDRRTREIMDRDRIPESEARARAAVEISEEDEARMRGQFRSAFSDGFQAALSNDFGEWFRNWIADWAARGLEDALNSIADLLYDVFRNALSQGGQGGDWLNGLARAFGGGSPGQGGIGKTGNSLGGKGLPGFKTGGSFTVGGPAGVDRNLIAFRATRGEMVDIRKPGQDLGASTQVFDMRGALVTAELLADINQRIAAGEARAVETAGRQVPARVNRGLARGQVAAPGYVG